MNVIKPRVYLCTDLDRTLIPNGNQPEPAGARQSFSNLVSRPDVGLIYVSGRDKDLILQAVNNYLLPMPDFVVADVGTSVYEVQGKHWHMVEQWHDVIKSDWQGNQASHLQALLGVVPGLTLQARCKQGAYKLSFERHPAIGLDDAVTALKCQLDHLNYAYQCVVSIDETTDTGLVDVLPPSANKRAALEFLQDYLPIKQDQIVFSGDSGNDLDVLLSPMRATLVGNATDEVRETAIDLIKKHQGRSLYLAKQYYAAGIVEGFYHYFPQYAPDQRELTKC